jgi:hypothetical protein
MCLFVPSAHLFFFFLDALATLLSSVMETIIHSIVYGMTLHLFLSNRWLFIFRIGFQYETLAYQRMQYSCVVINAK